MLIPQGWELVIGLETHVQLQTRSKIFSGASTAFGAEPDRQACAVDLGLPGVLPVLNREAVALAIRFGLAVGGQIAQRSIFARKNYFYPDLPKGYQISQYEIPVVSGGSIDIGDMFGQTENLFALAVRGDSMIDAGILQGDYVIVQKQDTARAGEIAAKIAPSPPETPEPFEKVFADFERDIAPGMTHWQHPRFFAYFPANAAPASMLAEQLANAMACQGMLWQTSPAATEIEQVMIEWLRDAGAVSSARASPASPGLTCLPTPSRAALV